MYMQTHVYVHACMHAWCMCAAHMVMCTLVHTPVYSILHTHAHWRDPLTER